MKNVNENEKVCGVKKKINQGLIDTGRYDRYVYIYQNLKEIDDRKYK